MHLSWSSVSLYAKSSSNCACQTVSFENSNPLAVCLLAYNLIRPAAIFLSDCFTLAFVLSQSPLPNLLTLGRFPSAPIYFWIRSIRFIGTYLSLIHISEPTRR